MITALKSPGRFAHHCTTEGADATIAVGGAVTDDSAGFEIFGDIFVIPTRN